MGKKIYPIINWGGLDVDTDWQVPLVKYWLKINGFTSMDIPYNRIISKKKLK